MAETPSKHKGKTSMRVKRLVLTAAGGALLAVGFAVPSQASLTIICDGTASDVTIPGDLVVRADTSCELTNVTITGTATVRANANLLLNDSVVEGALRVNSNGFASLLDSEANDVTRLNGAFGVYSEDSSHALNVVAADSDFFYSLGSSYGRNINSTNVETFLESSRVGRSVNSQGGLLTDVYDTVIEGGVSISGTDLGSVFCYSEVDGDASFSGNGGLLQIGAEGPVGDCGFNVFGASLNVTGNTADATISGNVIRGDLTCADNSPAPVVSDNRVRGEEQCDTASAAKLSTKSSVAAARSAATVKSEVLTAIEERIAEGEQAAEEAGPAFE
jgi:hypothetical protein